MDQRDDVPRPEDVRTLREFRTFVAALEADFATSGPSGAIDGQHGDWYSWTAGDLLEAMGAWLDDAVLSKPEDEHPAPTWALFATVLRAASSYE